MYPKSGSSSVDESTSAGGHCFSIERADIIGALVQTQHNDPLALDTAPTQNVYNDKGLKRQRVEQETTSSPPPLKRPKKPRSLAKEVDLTCVEYSLLQLKLGDTKRKRKNEATDGSLQETKKRRGLKRTVTSTTEIKQRDTTTEWLFVIPEEIRELLTEYIVQARDIWSLLASSTCIRKDFGPMFRSAYVSLERELSFVADELLNLSVLSISDVNLTSEHDLKKLKALRYLKTINTSCINHLVLPDIERLIIVGGKVKTWCVIPKSVKRLTLEDLKEVKSSPTLPPNVVLTMLRMRFPYIDTSIEDNTRVSAIHLKDMETINALGFVESQTELRYLELPTLNSDYVRSLKWLNVPEVRFQPSCMVTIACIAEIFELEDGRIDRCVLVEPSRSHLDSLRNKHYNSFEWSFVSNNSTQVLLERRKPRADEDSEEKIERLRAVLPSLNKTLDSSYGLEEESVGMLVSSPNAVQALASFPATGLKNFGVLDEEDKASPSYLVDPSELLFSSYFNRLEGGEHPDIKGLVIEKETQTRLHTQMPTQRQPRKTSRSHTQRLKAQHKKPVAMKKPLRSAKSGKLLLVSPASQDVNLKSERMYRGTQLRKRTHGSYAEPPDDDAMFYVKPSPAPSRLATVPPVTTKPPPIEIFDIPTEINLAEGTDYIEFVIHDWNPLTPLELEVFGPTGTMVTGTVELIGVPPEEAWGEEFSGLI